MTLLAHSRKAALLALGVAVALVAFAGTADARWYGNGWVEPGYRGWVGTDRYYGYYYREPPVVYGTPYRGYYGYYPPPVVYDRTPTFTLRIGP
jgi:hypothetical protein